MTRHRLLAGAMSAMLSGITLTATGALPLPLPDPLSPQSEGYLERARRFALSSDWQAVGDQLRNVDIYSLEPSRSIAAEFLRAQAAFNTADPLSATLLERFVASHPSSPLALDARLMLADRFFFTGDFQSAMRAYQEIDRDMLSGDSRRLYTYREALSMLKCGYYDEARALFRTLRDDKEYKAAADFYDAYIDYATGDLDTAYRKFSRLSGSRERGLEADYYLLQIEYRRGNYHEVASRGPRLLESTPAPALVPETMNVIGMSLFKLGDTNAARQWLERYLESAGNAAADNARYAVGTIYYDNGDIEKARQLFEGLTDSTPDISQSAWHYLGQIALADGDETTATLAFERASRYIADPATSETALYNYAAATTRGGKTPFGNGIDVLERFSSNFPSSRYASSVDEYLATAYYNANDYERALRSIDKISRPSAAVLAARQKIVYQLGMRRMVNGDAAGAVELLRQGAASGSDPRIAAQSSLWLGDALYSLGRYGEAAESYSRALSGSLAQENRGLALYNLGYARHKSGRYGDALVSFRKAAESNELDATLREDAAMRVADCLYYTGRYSEADQAYARLAEGGGRDAVYASMRRATLMGRNGDVAGKIKLLKSLADNSANRKSPWLPEILEQLAGAYAEKGDDAKAASVYERYLSLYPSGRRAASSALALARSLRKAGQTVKSEIEYRKVIENWPASEEARQADSDLRRIYASEGKLLEYAEYLRNAPGGFSIDAAEMEQLTFEAAEDAWNDDPDNLEPLRDYLRKYPNGSDAEAAWYMLAESLHDRGDRPGALEAYRRLYAYGPGEYYLAAIAGIMRDSDNDSDVLSAARALQSASGAGAELAEEATFYEASALSDARESASRARAASLLGQLARNPASLWGARAAVTLAGMQLRASQPSQAEKTLLVFIDAGTPHQYWLARGYILLADVYEAQGKSYLSRQYLESLRDNYPGNDLDIHDMITTRLRKLK